MPFETTNPAGARPYLDRETHRFVDVRSEAEFEAGHVPGAYNVPLMFKTAGGMVPNPDFAAAMQRLFPSDAKLVLV